MNDKTEADHFTDTSKMVPPPELEAKTANQVIAHVLDKMEGPDRQEIYDTVGDAISAGIVYALEHPDQRKDWLEGRKNLLVARIMAALGVSPRDVPDLKAAKAPVYDYGDRRQKIQLCKICDEPTGSCEDDHSYNYPGGCDDERIGPVCKVCHENPDEAEAARAAEAKAKAAWVAWDNARRAERRGRLRQEKATAEEEKRKAGGKT